VTNLVLQNFVGEKALMPNLLASTPAL